VIAFGICKKELRIFLERSLRTKEKELFLSLYESQGITFSAAVRKITDKNYPESTAKCILNRFKQFNLVDFGNQNSKGKPLIFTDLGNSFFKILRGELE
jgi:hypothetical protein